MSSRAYDRARDRIAAVNADLQESLSGVRVAQAYVREERNARSFRQLGGEYLDARLDAQRLVALYFPFVLFLSSRGRRRRARRRQSTRRERHAHHRRADRLHPLPRPVLLADPAAVPGVRHVAAGPCLDGSDRRADGDADGRPVARAPGPGPRVGRHPLRGRALPIPGRVERSRAGFRPRRPGRPDRGPGRRDRCRQVDHREAGRPVPRPDRRPGADRRRAADRDRPRRATGAASATCPRSRSSSPERCATTSPTGVRRPPTPRWKRRLGPSARTTSSRRFPAATAIGSPSADGRCPQANASSSAWPAPTSSTRRSCSSTRPPPTWTWPPRPACSRPWGWSRRVGRRWSSPTVFRPPAGPTASW